MSTTPRTTHGSPTRTCVGCRRTDSWSALLRVVAETDDTGAIRLTPDPRHRLPGRGAWLHPTGDCLDQALRRRAFGRALRTSTAPDPAAVTAYVEELATRPLAAPPEK
ncbi:YlxR family protein [Knoellia sp. DB2414S]|uniref:YlxR family protein n=1 Tax=Knoellia koreensis TaxID=2730921 RepID=A0A849HGT2_9MICO|nr:YlxR family protein [Knoellia sp. DB2414S]